MSQNTASNESEGIIELTEVVEYASKKEAPPSQKIDFDSQLSDLIGKGKEINVNNPPELEALLAGIGEEAQEGGGAPQIDLSAAEIIEPGSAPVKKHDPRDLDSLIEDLDVPPNTQETSSAEGEGEVADLDSLLDSLFSSPAAAQIASVDKAQGAAGGEADLSDMLDMSDMSDMADMPDMSDMPELSIMPDTPAPAKESALPELELELSDMPELSDLPKGGTMPKKQDEPLSEPDLDDLLASVMNDTPVKPKASPPPQPQPQAQPLSTDELDALFDDVDAAPAGKGKVDPLDAILDALPSNVTPKHAPDTAVIPTQDELDTLLADLDPHDAMEGLPLVSEPMKPAAKAAQRMPSPPPAPPAPQEDAGGLDAELDALFAKSDQIEPVAAKPKAAEVKAAPPDLLMEFETIPEQPTPQKAAPQAPAPQTPAPQVVPSVDRAEVERLEGMLQDVVTRIGTIENEIRDTEPVTIDWLGELTEGTPVAAAIQDMILTRLASELPGRIAEQLPSLLPAPEEPEPEPEAVPAEEDPVQQALAEVQARLGVLEEWQQSELLAAATSSVTSEGRLDQMMGEIETVRGAVSGVHEELESLREELRAGQEKASVASEEAMLRVNELQTRLTELEAVPAEAPVDTTAVVMESVLSAIRPEIQQVAAVSAASEETTTAMLNTMQSRLAALEERPEAPNAANIAQDVLTLVHADMEQAAHETSNDDALSGELESLKQANATLVARLAVLEARAAQHTALEKRLAELEARAAQYTVLGARLAELEAHEKRSAALNTRLAELEARNAQYAALEIRLADLENRPAPQVILPELPDVAAVSAEVIAQVQGSLEKSATEAAARILREEILALFSATK